MELGPEVNFSWLLTNVLTSLCGRPGTSAAADDELDLDVNGLSKPFILAASLSDSSSNN